MQEILFYKPTINEKEMELIKRALSENGSSLIDEFEAKLKGYFGAKHAILTTSRAATQHLALSAMDVKRGDKFICSVNAFPSIAQAIRQFDAEPIFVDIDEDDFTISIDALKECLARHNHKKLRGIFVNHIAGQSAKMDEIYALAGEYGIDVLDDANRAVGLSYEGKKIGATGSRLTSFQIRSQTLHSIAEAGFMITNDDDLAQKARLLRNYALVSKANNNNYIYDVVDIGLKYDISAINAAFAIAQFDKHLEFIKKRQEIAAIYDEQLKECSHISTPVKKRDHIYNQYIIKVDKNRDGFAKALLECGIHTSLHYVPIHLLSYYKNKYNLKVNNYPTALKNYQQILSLPIYSALKHDEVAYICSKIKEIAKSRG